MRRPRARPRRAPRLAGPANNGEPVAGTRSSTGTVAMLLQLQAVVAAAVVAGNSACYVEPGVEYLQPAHYKEFKGAENATADACCARCAADGAKCGSWKLCHYSDGLSCRLRTANPTKPVSVPEDWSTPLSVTSAATAAELA